MPFQLQSRAAPIPKDAVAGFATASSLLQKARSSDGIGSSANCKKSVLVERVGSKNFGNVLPKPRKETGGKEGPNPLFKKPKVLREEPGPIREPAERVEPPVSDSRLMADEALPAKKPRKRKSKEQKPEEGQTKIRKTKITKPGTSKSADKPMKAAGTAKTAKPTVNETFNTLLPSQEEDARAREEFRDLCLEKAIPIRRDWTPCRDTVQHQAIQEGGAMSSASVALTDTPTTIPAPDVCFGKLLGEYGFAQKDEDLVVRTETTPHTDGEKVIKKRKIELVNGVNVPPPLEKPKRTKSPKKKPQTITEKATAPFVPVDAMAAPSLLQYFDSPRAEVEIHTDGPVKETPVTVRRKSPVRKPAKSQAAVPKAKKPKQPVLLSPESAMKNAGDQELVFGTSSQLAREESPTMIKDLQQAMEESATMSQEWGTSALSAGKFRSSHASVLARPRNLWSVASRDAKGSLLEAETVDLTETPRPPKVTAQIVPHECVASEVVAQEHSIKSDEPQALPDSIVGAPYLNLGTTPVLQQRKQEPDLAIPRSVAEATLKKRPSNRSPVKNASNPKKDPNQMPNYQGFTDAQLAKEVAAYGFKSIKRRTAMITLLEQCWESKVAMARQEAEANLKPSAPIVNSATTEIPKLSPSATKRGRPPKSTTLDATGTEGGDTVPPKKPRGRPKKDPNATTPPPKRKRKAMTETKSETQSANLAADDIYDSSPPTPSPPRRRPPKSPGQLPLNSPRVRVKRSKSTTENADHTLLFAQITKAIMTFSPTHDPKNLTIYERILMYEPIILEDLTVWLNTVGLGKVGEDDEVDPDLVKKWCEEKSVCCSWKENHKGEARKRW